MKSPSHRPNVQPANVPSFFMLGVLAIAGLRAQPDEDERDTWERSWRLIGNAYTSDEERLAGIQRIYERSDQAWPWTAEEEAWWRAGLKAHPGATQAFTHPGDIASVFALAVYDVVHGQATAETWTVLHDVHRYPGPEARLSAVRRVFEANGTPWTKMEDTWWRRQFRMALPGRHEGQHRIRGPRP